MKFKVDENLSGRVVIVLRSAGHDALTVADQGLKGSEDAELTAHAKAEGRALVTLDMGFSDVRAYPPGEHAGIIVLRPRKQNRRLLLVLVAGLLPLLKREPLAGRLWVAEPDRVRIFDRSGP